MSLITALAVSIGGLGGIATWLFLGPLGGALQIWAAFIAWACFFHSGGKEAALGSTIACTLAGAVVAWITLIIITQTGVAGMLGLPIWAGIMVAIGVGVMVLLANMPMFATIPALVYGFAAVAAYTLLADGAIDRLMAASLDNPLVTVGLSLIAGALLGWLSEKLAGAMAGSQEAPAG